MVSNNSSNKDLNYANLTWCMLSRPLGALLRCTVLSLHYSCYLSNVQSSFIENAVRCACCNTYCTVPFIYSHGSFLVTSTGVLRRDDRSMFIKYKHQKSLRKIMAPRNKHNILPNIYLKHFYFHNYHYIN